MNDEPDLILQFPELCDELVVVLHNLLEELLTQFQNHYFVSVRAAPIDGGKHRFYSAPELRCRLISGSTSSVVVPEVMNKSSAASSLCMSW